MPSETYLMKFLEVDVCSRWLQFRILYSTICPFASSICNCLNFNVSSLPIMEKDEQFLRVIGILLSSVATINSAYNENNPCLNSTPMLLE